MRGVDDHDVFIFELSLDSLVADLLDYCLGIGENVRATLDSVIKDGVVAELVELIEVKRHHVKRGAELSGVGQFPLPQVSVLDVVQELRRLLARMEEVPCENGTRVLHVEDRVGHVVQIDHRGLVVIDDDERVGVLDHLLRHRVGERVVKTRHVATNHVWWVFSVVAWDILSFGAQELPGCISCAHAIGAVRVIQNKINRSRFDHGFTSQSKIQDLKSKIIGSRSGKAFYLATIVTPIKIMSTVKKTKVIIYFGSWILDLGSHMVTG